MAKPPKPKGGRNAKQRVEKQQSERIAYDPLQLLVGAGIALSEIDDYSELLAKIVDTALEVGSCEGVSIYQVFDEKLKFVASRNRVLEAQHATKKFTSFLLAIDGGTIAGYVAMSRKILNIDDVYNIPADASYAYSTAYDKMNNYRSQSMVVLPMCDTKGNILGVMQLINHVEHDKVVPFPSSLEPYLRALASQVGVVMRNVGMAEELRRSRVETVKRFVKASEYHDADTGGHIERMSSYSRLLARKLGMSEDFCERIKLASMLHDVGKISIPDAVLKKPGLLNEDERKIMNMHAVNGYEMLADAESPFLHMGAVIALTHHEKWDGSGYPRGLKGEDIPVEGRIVALADVFDALCSRRVYKEAWPIEKVLDIIKTCRGTHFDPNIVDLFFKHLNEIFEIRDQFPVDTPAEDPEKNLKASA